MKSKLILASAVGLILGFGIGHFIKSSAPAPQPVDQSTAAPTPSVASLPTGTQWSRLKNYSNSFEYPTGWHVAITEDYDVSFSEKFHTTIGPEPLFLLGGTDAPSEKIGWVTYRNTQLFNEVFNGFKSREEFSQESLQKSDSVQSFKYRYLGSCGIDGGGTKCYEAGYYVVINHGSYVDTILFHPEREDYSQKLAIAEHIALSFTP